MNKLNREGALLHLLLTNKKVLAEYLKVKGSLGGSDYEIVDFKRTEQDKAELWAWT